MEVYKMYNFNLRLKLNSVNMQIYLLTNKLLNGSLSNVQF